MLKKIISLTLPKIAEWAYETQFQKRFDHVLKVELLYLSEPEELEYTQVLNNVLAMYQLPRVANVLKLIGSDHLGRDLLQINTGVKFNVDNHLGQLELLCLQKNVMYVWQELSSDEKQKVIDFCRDKTIATIGSQAECFTLYLKDFIDGLISFQSQIRSQLNDAVKLRRMFYSYNKRRLN
ncbi:MAG: hypothetical protein A2Y40_01710 [Candidatus Margulisbacteria bacterium GWF2_35_9]|nr:MAG: hypothetical protein A2Y40_01710 [Candidatus Margulisbacteria bacterium GWF2_35_9]